MKLSKKQKIITTLIGIGAILGVSLGISLPILINKNSDNVNINQSNKSKIEAIKTKIQNKNLVIPKNVNTLSDLEIFLAIKNQLKLKNSGLTQNDFQKITDNIQHLKPGKKTSVILKIELENLFDTIKISVTKEKNIKLWTKNSAIVTNSNINDGRYSSFIQDSSGNLWVMGGEGGPKGWLTYRPTKLQVLKRDGTQWEEAINSGLTNGSNVVNGNKGIIFEDDFGNIWSMGKGTSLQVLVKNKDGSYASSWVNDNTEGGEKLLQGSNITNGEGGEIFQDDSGNLWAMSKGSKLQVLAKNKDGSYASSWDVDNSENGKLLKGSNINNGHWGKIFQDDFGNLWAMSKDSRLQVLAKNKDGSYASSWDVDNSQNGKLLKGSNISNGYQGKIFQDDFGNLWTIGDGAKLQVLRANQSGDNYVIDGWFNNTEEGLLKNSNIINHFNGTIFQDYFGNLWTHGYSKKPQVLEVNQDGNGYDETAGWNSDNTQGLLNNLRIRGRNRDNAAWVFFQDSSKNLWAMGNQIVLQVLRANQNGDGYVSSWENDTNVEGLLKDSGLTDGQWGLIFEDSSKNLWAMGWAKKLQVYDKTQKKWIS